MSSSKWAIITAEYNPVTQLQLSLVGKCSIVTVFVVVQTGFVVVQTVFVVVQTGLEFRKLSSM